MDLAIRLCWFFAARFPARTATEYCATEADPFFLQIADALENGHLAKVDYEQAKSELQQGVLPTSLKSLLGVDF